MNDYTAFADLYDLFYADLDDDFEMYLGFVERSSGPILEVGSGTGRVALMLAEAGHAVVGLEPSDTMRAVAQRKADRAKLAERVAFISGDMRRFKIDQSFGLIIVPLNTFLHNLTLEDQLATLSSLKKHLKPGGLLVLDCFNPDPAHAADDHFWVLHRVQIDPATGAASLLYLSRTVDWGHQQQENIYIAEQPLANNGVQRIAFTTNFRFVFRHEMTLLLKQGGFDVKEVYGSYELDPFESGSDKLIVVATPA
jgi:SAM-dependent methyltransferase